MNATLDAGNGYTIELKQIEGGGSPWIVRTCHRVLFFKRVISSDWFLDAAQAKRFAEQLRDDIGHSHNTSLVSARKPGWTLHRPAH